MALLPSQGHPKEVLEEIKPASALCNPLLLPFQQRNSSFSLGIGAQGLQAGEPGQGTEDNAEALTDPGQGKIP